ncbi:MAG TPA: hypothetical protein VMB85_15550 [Bryobacteraceae bacterium]|nr:hypothetical protein [Bryobacteraceae bacterium]
MKKRLERRKPSFSARVTVPVFVLALAISAWAQSGLDRPPIGMMLDATGAARPVSGLPGSASVADPTMTGVVALGCGSFCLIKTNSSLIAAGQSVAASAGPALFAFDSSGAFVYFSQTRQLARWQSGQLTPVDYNVSGEIVSIASVGGVPQFATRQGGEIQVVSNDGAVMDVFPRGVGPLMLLSDGVLFSTGRAVVLRRPGASDIEFPLARAISFTAMSPDFIEVRAAAAIFALRLTPGREQLFELPQPLTTQPQLSLFTFDGATETPVGATYNYGDITDGASSAVRFRIFNNSTSGIEVYGPVVSGAGFAISAINGTPPVIIPPDSSTLNFFEFSVTFSADGLAPGNYSASLQISGPSIATISVLLLATMPGTSSQPGQPPAVTVLNGAGCSPNGVTAVAFANVNIGSIGLCNFTLTNLNSFPITISAITVTANSGFTLQQAPSMPLILNAGESTAFTVQFTPVCGPSPAYSGALSIVSTYYPGGNTYPLSGNGITLPLPTPSLVFDAQNFSSVQQHTLSISLPSPSACGANGYVNLTFTPAANLPDDSTIAFMSGSTRTLPISVAPGSAQVLIGGNASATFATGTTAGTISFSLSGVTVSGASPTASFTIAPAAIYIDSASASNQAYGQLNITVVGYDNTYSAGQMTFTFFDGNNQQVGQPISANFTSRFQALYAGQTMGSTFLMQVSFPVTGYCVPSTLTPDCPANQVIATVQATLTNSAGQTQTGTLTFQ